MKTLLLLIVSFLAFLLVIAPTLGIAEGNTFTVSSSALPVTPEENTQTSMIARLKHQAVVEYLQRQLGARYAQHEAQVTPEFTEHFVLDYKVIKSANGHGQIDLSGHLDADALRRWVRVTEAKGGGGMKPLFLLSSQVPEVPISPRETPAKIHEGAFGPTLFGMVNPVFQKFSAKLAVMGGEIGLQQPPRKDADFKLLRDFAQPHGYNSALWVNISPCRGCGTKVDIYLINIAQGRLILAKSDDVPLEARDFSSADRVRKELKETMKAFSSEFEELVSAGTVFSAAYRVVVENVDQYKSFKQIDGAFSKLDYLVQSVLKRSEGGVADFQVLSPLAPEDLYSRLQLGNFPGFDLKPVRQEGATLYLRYTK